MEFLLQRFEQYRREEWRYATAPPTFGFPLGTALELVLTRALSSDQAFVVSPISLPLQAIVAMFAFGVLGPLQACDRAERESLQIDH